MNPTDYRQDHDLAASVTGGHVRPTTPRPAPVPRNVAKLPTDERAPFVVTFVGERVEVIVKNHNADPETITGRAAAVATDYGRGGHVLILVTDTGRVLAFSMAIVRNIKQAPAVAR